MNDATPEYACVICGADLSGHAAQARCPSCKLPVERSAPEDQLDLCPPEYIDRLRRGAFLILAGVVIALVTDTIEFSLRASGVVQATMRSVPDTLLSIVGVCAGCMRLVGWWKFSSPDPSLSVDHDDPAARRLVRTAVVGLTVALLIEFAINLARLTPSSGAPQGTNPNSLGPLRDVVLAMLVVRIVFFSIWFFASMLYLRWLAPRIPNAKAYRRSKTLMWLGPLLSTVGALCIFIGPLIALALYWNVIYWIWKDLKVIQDRQRGLDTTGLA